MLDLSSSGSARRQAILEPQEILDELLEGDRNLHEESYYSERALFYNPGRSAPLGVIFAAVKDHDGPNDRSSRLSRPGVFRLAFQVSREEYRDRFGPAPPRPPKGAAVTIEHDPSVLDELTPHPIYAWMCWAQVLCPLRATFDSLLPLMEVSLESVRRRWRAKFAPG